MNTNSASPDDLDRLLSGFFKAQMKEPWPAAPTPGMSEPAAPRVRSRLFAGHERRARLTLAASIAFLLGIGWALSGEGSAPQRVRRTHAHGGSTITLEHGTAGHPAALEQLKKDHATHPELFLDPAQMKDIFNK